MGSDSLYDLAMRSCYQVTGVEIVANPTLLEDDQKYMFRPVFVVNWIVQSPSLHKETTELLETVFGISIQDHVTTYRIILPPCSAN